MPTFNTFEMKQSFWKSVKLLWRYGIFCLRQFTGWKWEISNLVDGLSFHPFRCKTKIPAHVKFSTQMPTFNTFEMKQSFWKSVKYLWRYRIFAATVYRLKVGNFKSFRWAKFPHCHCKSKIPAHVKFSAQLLTFNMWEMKQSFWKSVKYLPRYRIFAGTVYRLKVGNFKSCRWAKFSPCYCKTKIPAHLTFSAQMPTFNTHEMKQSFWKSVKHLRRHRILDGKVYRLKVGNVKSCRWAKFSPCHCKSKIPPHLKCSAQIPTFNKFEMQQSFWKSVKYLWRYRIFAGTVYRLKVENFKFVDGLSFHLVIAKLKYLRTWNSQPKCPLSTRLRWSKVFENRLNTFADIGFLLGQFTGWIWKISNLFDGLSFHLVIEKGKYLRTWNFRPKCPRSTRFRWTNFFEYR